MRRRAAPKAVKQESVESDGSAIWVPLREYLSQHAFGTVTTFAGIAPAKGFDRRGLSAQRGDKRIANADDIEANQCDQAGCDKVVDGRQDRFANSGAFAAQQANRC